MAPSKPCQNFLQHSFRECEISPRHIVYIKLLSLYNHYTARETMAIGIGVAGSGLLVFYYLGLMNTLQQQGELCLLLQCLWPLALYSS